MKTANPFTLTFGQKPAEFISRGDQINRILDNFDMEVPSNTCLPRSVEHHRSQT